MYLYDLPRNEYTSHKIARIVKDKTGITLNEPPNILRDVQKKFLNGFMKIECDTFDEYMSVCEKMRFFEIDGKECRALPFEENIFANDDIKLDNQTFVRNIPKTMKQAELYDIFTKYGQIKRCMIILDFNHKSKGYGFIHFKEKEATNKAIE